MMWTYEKHPNWVIKGPGKVASPEYFEEGLEGYVRLGINGWVHVDVGEKTHSFSPAMALEITWKVKFEDDPED